MKMRNALISILLTLSIFVKAQESESEAPKLRISGDVQTDERFLFENKNAWAWNENRLTLKFDKNIVDNSKFYSEVWVRNIGLPNLTSSSDLYNKGFVDPYNLEIREAYFQVTGFLHKNLDLKIGRQRITWGTADKINPTDNLNPYDMEDILDFGRHRGSDAINLQYYFSENLSLQGVFVPFFQAANLPAGIFSNSLSAGMVLPQGLSLRGMTDTLLMPAYNLGESSTAGIKLKGVIKRVDVSLSYVWGRDGLPFAVNNTFIPVDAFGGVNIHSQLSFLRQHIIGADLAGNIGGIGLWAEAAAFIPENNGIMTNDLTALFPLSPVPVRIDSLVLDKSKPWFKFIIGGDYSFSDGSYLNLQYIHGFIHERGAKSLNDYFFVRYEKKFLREKLGIAPVSGAFIVSDWEKVKDNYAFAYIPQISYKAVEDVELILSAAIFDGKGDNMFAGLKKFDMFILKAKYSF